MNDMTQASRPPRYGVIEQTASGNEIDQAFERLRLTGCTVLDAQLPKSQQQAIADAFESVRQTFFDRFGEDELRALDEHNTLRAPLAFDDLFLQLAQNEPLRQLCGRVFSGVYLLNQQNGIVNPPNDRYNQAAWHRDLPYQHFVASRPVAINALYCIDDFTIANGATQILAGSHKQEAFPSDDVVKSLAASVEAPAGSFLVLDCMTYHQGGRNGTSAPRRAVNHLFTLPFVKPQIDFRTLLADRDVPEPARKLLGLDDIHPAASIEAYYAERRSRLG